MTSGKQNLQDYSVILHQKFESVVQSLCQNNSIPTSVKVAFKAVRQLMDMHSDNMQDLQKQLVKKASKTELNQLLSQKVSIGDMSTVISELRDIMDKKVGVMDFNTMLEESSLVGQLNRKLQTMSLKMTNENEIISCLMRDTGETVEQLQKDQHKTQSRLDDYSREAKQIKNYTTKLYQKIEKNSQKWKVQFERNIYQVKTTVAKLQQQLKSCEVAANQSNAALRKKIEESTAKIQTLETSPSTNNINNGLKESILQTIGSIKQTCEQNEKDIKKLNKGLRKKDYEAIQQIVIKAVQKLRREFTDFVSQRTTSLPSKTELPYRSQQKDIYVTKECLTKELMQWELVLNGKTSLNEVKLAFKAFQQDILYNIETIRSELNRRLDNQLLNKCRQPVDLYDRSPIRKNMSVSALQYLTVEEFRRYEHDQNIIYESICSQNIVGRWSFKGEPNSSRIACWQTEMINTLPDNFVWVPQSHYIKIKNAGLYWIVVGMFTECRKSMAEVLINEKRLSRIANCDKEDNCSEEIARTLIQYVFLRENARISVYFSSTKSVEGFISLKRL